jgi:hypothetical protein
MKFASRIWPLPAALLFLGATVFLMAATSGNVPRGGLTVHEWGTFTSVAGADGSAIEWNTLGCQSDLPKFVNDFGYRGFKWRLQGTVRMETPVLYFYSPRELAARVKVGFPHGLITEWYPKAEYRILQQDRLDGPAQPVPENLSGIDTSLGRVTGDIEWNDIKVQPGTAPTLPMESGPDRYYAARATDAAPLAVGGQHEKFLFYRGVGNFQPPLSARVSAEGKVTLENRGRGAVPTVILFENRGGRIGYRNAGGVAGTAALNPPALDGSVVRLRQELEAALVAQGLFPKEARAMVETWRDSWFEEGTRLIYVLPTAAVDGFLPLEVEPAPERIDRVFVGRIELITPDTVRSLESAISRGDWASLQPYRRFLDPMVSRVYPGDSARVSQVERLYREFESQHGQSCQ